MLTVYEFFFIDCQFYNLLFLDFPLQPTFSLSRNKTYEGDIIDIECSSGSANPEPVLTVYKSGAKLGDSKIGRNATYQLRVQREMNREYLYCTITSSNENKLNYTLMSISKTVHVLCK